MRLATTLTDKLHKEKIIQCDEMDVVHYGLEYLEMNFLGVLLTLLVGFLHGKMQEALILWIAMFPLRKNAGGFHANTRKSCFLISFIVLFLAFSILCKIQWSGSVLWLVRTLTWAIIFCLAPVECFNKQLEELEKKKYGKRTRIVLLVEVVLSIVAYLFHLNSLLRGLTMCFSIIAVSLLAGKVKFLILKKRIIGAEAYYLE